MVTQTTPTSPEAVPLAVPQNWTLGLRLEEHLGGGAFLAFWVAWSRGLVTRKILG